jgi:hypothetical protein
VSTYEVTTDDGSVYQVDTQDAAPSQPSLLDNAIEDVKGIPGAAVNLAKEIPYGVQNLAALPGNLWGAGNDATRLLLSKVLGTQFTPYDATAQDAAARYDQLDRTFRGIGGLSAAVAGGGLGSGLIAGALGGAAGIEGYNKLNQATGSDVATTPQEDLRNLERNTIQGAGLGLGFKAAALPFSGASAVADSVSDVADNTADTLTKNAMGLSRSARANATKNGVEWIDETGNRVEPENATDFVTKIDKNLGIIDSDVGINTLPNSAAAIKQIFDQKTSDLAEQIAQKKAMADAALQAQESPVQAPHEAAQPYDWWPSLNQFVQDDAAAKAGKVTPQAMTIEPDWSLAEDYIQNGKGTAGFKPQLQKALNAVKADWLRKEGTFSDLVDFKQEVNDGRIFKDNATLSEAVRAQLRRQIYYGVQKAAESYYDELVPHDSGNFADVNQKYSAYKSFEKPLANRIEGVAQNTLTGLAHQGAGAAIILGALTHGHPALGAAGIVGNLLARYRPLTSASLLSRVLSPAASGVGSGASAISDLLSSVIPAATAAGVVANNQTSGLGSLLAPIVSSRIADAEPVTSVSEPQNKQSSLSAVKAAIKADPFYSAVAQTESSFEPKAKNPNSSAKGLFQLINATAKAVGVTDPLDPAQNFEGMKQLTAQNKAIFGDNPVALYAAHVLGAPLLAKALKGGTLSAKEQEQVLEFKSKALPHFIENYKKEIGAA